MLWILSAMQLLHVNIFPHCGRMQLGRQLTLNVQQSSYNFTRPDSNPRPQDLQESVLPLDHHNSTLWKDATCKGLDGCQLTLNVQHSSYNFTCQFQKESIRQGLTSGNFTPIDIPFLINNGAFYKKVVTFSLIIPIL